MQNMEQSIQRGKKGVGGEKSATQKQKDWNNNKRNKTKHKKGKYKESTAKTKRDETRRKNERWGLALKTRKER